MDKTILFGRYCSNILIALDQLVNTLLLGWPDETLSSRCYRNKISMAVRLIDLLFFWETDHCKSSYQSEIERLQLPPESRKCPYDH